MSEARQAMNKLAEFADELDRLSKAQAEVSRRLEPADTEYEQFITDFEVGLWNKVEGGHLSKLPSEAMRTRLAHKEISPELLGRREGLRQSRERITRRISDLKQMVDAQRSILSALKTEIEATQ